ncbi:MAG TPA: glycosyltransferase [bacterium (Candidatus Stahlbacteria)]|nr:glycosyltransferase [Candidatus Stahlbacteria bacterium]
MAKKKRKNKTSNPKSVSPPINTDKIKVVAFCDTPSCATGFGTVSRNIFEGLFNTGRYQIDILGINYWGNPHPFPYRIWPTGTNPQQDPYGRKKVCSMIPRMEFDLLFFLQDTFIFDFLPELMPFLRQRYNRDFRTICYYPIDGMPKEKWIKNISVIDYPVAYCEFGKEMSKKAYVDCPDVGVIPHGVNTKEYFPIVGAERDEFRKKYFAAHADKFVFTNLNRNQQRKDIPRTIMAFKEFKKRVPDSILYLHMAMKDQGWDLVEVCKSFGLSINDDVIFPENFGPNQGYPRELVNLIYNISDCVVSTCLGEGFGLSWIEAMATNTPIIMPNNTALTEFITEDRGYLVDSGTKPSLFTVLGHDNEVIRPLVDVDDMVKKMLQVHNNYEEAKQKADNAYKWVTTEMDWQKHIVPRWVEVFDKAYEDLQKESEKIDDVISQLGSKKIETEEF